MTFWISLWKFTLIATLAVFAGMTVYVTIGGARDIRRLFERLRETRDKPDPEG